MSWPTPDIARALRPARPLLLAADGLWDLHAGERHDGFAAWCSGHARQRCTLWVGSTHLSDLVCEAGLPLHGGAARMDWARRVFTHYHGASAEAWPLLPWRWRAARGVSALQGVALSELRAQAAAHGVALVAVRPLWPLLLERVLAERPALRSAAQARVLLLERASPAGGALATVLTLHRGALQSVRRRRLDEPVPDALQALLQQDGATQNMAAQAYCASTMPTAAWSLGVPGLQALPSSTLDRVADTTAPYRSELLRGRAAAGDDFLQPLPRPSALAWAGLAVSLLVLAVAGFDAREAWQARSEARAAGLAVMTRAAVPALVPGVALSPAQAALRQRLAHPWREVFQASELPAAGGLAWLTLEHQIGGDLRLQGVAPAGEPVQRAAAALRSRASWQQVLVSRLEVEGDGLSFEIVARLANVRP